MWGVPLGGEEEEKAFVESAGVQVIMGRFAEVLVVIPVPQVPVLG